MTDARKRTCRTGDGAYSPNVADSQRDQVRALFDRVSHDYATVEFFKPLGEALVGFAAPSAGSVLLDLGAGRGAVTRPAAEAVGTGGFVTAVDVSLAMSSALNNDMSSVAWVRCIQTDATALPFRSEAFDCVVSGFAVHILPDPAQALAEAYRVLRPGGSVAFSTPGPSGRSGMQRYGEVIQEYSQRASRHLWSLQPPPDFPATLEAVGFVDLSESSSTVSIPMLDAATFLATDLSHGFRGWVDALTQTDRSAFVAHALAALREAETEGTLTMDRGARLLRATKPRHD